MKRKTSASSVTLYPLECTLWWDTVGEIRFVLKIKTWTGYLISSFYCQISSSNMEIQGPQKFSTGSQFIVVWYLPRKNSPLQLILATKISTPTWPFVQQRIFQFFSHIFLRLLPIALHCIALHCYCMVLHERHLILPFFHVPAFVGGGRIWPNRILLQLTRSFFKYQIFLDFSWTIQFLVQFQDISLLANLIHRLHLLLRGIH